MDLHEWNQIKDESKVRKEMDDAVTGVNPDWAVWFMSTVRPYMTYAYHHTVKNGMNAGFAAADAREAAKAEAERSANGSTGEPNVRKPKAERAKAPPKEKAPAERPVNRVAPPLANGSIADAVPEHLRDLCPRMLDDPVWQRFAAEHGVPLPNGEVADVPIANGSTGSDR
jgi:hypothetical protein